MHTSLLVVLLFVVVINGLPYEQTNEEDDRHHLTQNRKHEGKSPNRRHKRYFLNQIGYAPQNAEYSNPGYGFYQPPPMIGFCPPWPQQKPVEECPEKQILRDLIKVMQNPPSIRVTCATGKVNVTPANPDIPNRGNFLDDEKEDLSKLEKERNWGMVDQFPESTPEEQAQYGSRDIELNPYSTPKLNKNTRKADHTISNVDRCHFVYTACCNDEETIESCYKKNGCEKTYREGNSCIELPKDVLHSYIRKTFRYSNGN